MTGGNAAPTAGTWRRTGLLAGAAAVALAAVIGVGYALWPDGDEGQEQGQGSAATPTASAGPAQPLAERQAAFSDPDLLRFADGVVAESAECRPRETLSQEPYAETGAALPEGLSEVVRCTGAGFIAYLYDGGSAPVVEELRQRRTARGLGGSDMPDGVKASQFIEWGAGGQANAIYYEPFEGFDGAFVAADVIATGGQDTEALRTVFVRMMGG